MRIVSVAGVALLGGFLLLLLRELRPAFAYPARVAVLLCLFAASLALALPVIAQIRALLAGAEGAELASPVLRALGIALIAEFSASFCRDLGENGLADGVLFFGKAEILLLSLPLFEMVLDIAKELLQF